MKISFRLILFLAIITVLVAACSKGGGSGVDNGSDDPHYYYSPTDTTSPVVEIYTPISNQVFNSANVISITGKLTDDLGLYRGSIRITNDATGELLKEQLYEIHYILLYNYNITYTPTVTVPSDYTVTVSFEDHGLNTTTRSVKVKVNP